jgi:hypothetical protein
VNQSRFARNSLVTLTSGVAAITFTVSFHGLNGYGLRVMHLGVLSPFVPAGVDMASLVALIATHMRHGERLRRRAYAWLVFITTALLSVAGNLADGYARHLPTAGLVGVACAPIVFVLVSHLAITSWRSRGAGPAPALTADTAATTDTTTTAATTTDTAAANRPATEASPTTRAAGRDAKPAAQPTTRPARQQVARRPASADKVAKAAAKMPGATVAAIAAKAGVSESTARRYLPTTADAGTPAADPAAGPAADATVASAPSARPAETPVPTGPTPVPAVA